MERCMRLEGQEKERELNLRVYFLELEINRCFQTVVLESPLDSKEIKIVNLRGNQPRICIGRTDAEAAILWPPDMKSQLIGKDFDAGKD